MIFRRLIELFARGRKIRRHITIDGREISMYVSPDSQLKYLKRSGSWDQDLVLLAQKYIKPGDEVWDIGANVGVFTFAAAAMSKTGNVLAFEPDTFLIEVIRASRKRNGLRNVQAIPAAIASEDGFAEFLVAERGRASNSLKSAVGRSQMGGVRDSFLVPTFSGESVHRRLNSRPSFIKIDVEGAELQVLEGCKSVLRSLKPLVFIELGAESRELATKLLLDLGYRCDSATDPECDDGFGNFLFTPL